MAERSEDQIREKREMAEKIIRHHFGETPKNVDYQHTGLTNFVFECRIPTGEFMVRLADKPDKISDYKKEQWAVGKAREAGVPVAEILEVGDDIVALPYMLQRKTPGSTALHHPERKTIIRQMGSFAKIINSIRTHNYGSVFDWSDEGPKHTSWKQYLAHELEVSSRLEVLEQNNMLSKENMEKLLAYLDTIENWEIAPVLNHSDIRLKNVITDDAGKILALLDWENCQSNIAPAWELSIALHDLWVDEMQEFLLGYGLAADEYREHVYAMKTFNILNYTKQIRKLAEEQESGMLEQYRLRLNGYYDLFSL